MTGRTIPRFLRCRLRVVPLLLGLLLGAFCVVPGAAQPVSERQFKHYSISDGLSNNLTTDILQDRRGFVWIATDGGLNRFDGYSFKVFQHNPFDPSTIGGNDVRCLYEDRSGCIWAGLSNGEVSRFDPQTERFTNYLCIEQEQNKPVDGDISGIVEDADGRLWVSIDRHGILCLDPETGAIVRYQSDPDDPGSLSHNAVTSIALGRDGALWITTWGGGLNRFDPQTERFNRIVDWPDIPGGGLFVNQMCQYHDRHGFIWIGTSESGLYRTDAALQHWWRYTADTADASLGISDDSVNHIAEDADGNIWIATLGGVSIYRYETDRFEHLRLNDTPNSLRTNHITSLCCDSDGSMWIGSSNGLHFYNRLSNRFNKYDIRTWDKQSEDGFIYSLLKLRDGNLLVKGRHDLLLFDRENQRVTPVHYASPAPRFIRRAVMMEDSQGRIWFGYTLDYITCYDPATRRREDIALPSGLSGFQPFRSVRSLYEDTDGSIWLATETGALNYDPRTGRFMPLFQSLQLIYPEDKVRVILRDSSGDLWVGTEGGLKRYDRQLVWKENYIASMPNSISNNFVTAIHEDREHTLWVGTRAGLHRFDRETNTFTLLMRPDARSGDAVMAIAEDDACNLWISSKTGIIQYNYAEDRFRLYDVGDGLQSREFNQGVVAQGQDGEILFGGIAGFNAFYPDRIQQNTRQPQVYVTDMQIFNQSEESNISSVVEVPATTLHEIRLKYWQSMVTFQFAALNYIAPEQCRYAYMLEGLDNGWNYTPSARRFATYTNLSAGTYTFRVRASNNDGIWNDEGVSIRIIILPPFWKTWWAYLLYTLAGIVLFAVILRYVARREQVKARIELERLEAKQQHEADQLKLQLFTNISHEFRTSLTLIQGPLDYILTRSQPGEERPLLEIMRRNTARLKRLINQLLDFRKLEVSKLTVHLVTQDILPCLHEVCDIYRFYAEQRCIRFSFHAAFAAKVMDFDRDKVDKILYNLLSNAFNYTDDGGEIAVEADETERDGIPMLRIRVKDTGMGIAAEDLKHLFTLFYQVEGREVRYRGGSGLGLNMTRELVQLLGGQIAVASEKGRGSEFTVLLPVKHTGIETAAPQALAVPERQPAAAPAGKQPESGRERGLVLVVEDNGDMRAYIRQVLEPEGYRVLEAPNGQAGLELAIEQMPDLIVSDVMMPVMDGREMLVRLKEDERINHIPILLLTAVSEECEMIRSFEAGVDGYITKPFSAPLLCTRINNILDNRRRLLERYTAPQTEGVPAVQERYAQMYIDPFIAKMKEQVAARLQDHTFDVETLAAQFCMSASQLTRKCRSLMNDTPWNFIIKCRMEQAARLIRETDKPISEIAWACGYTEKSNFSRAFTKHFGKSPSQYKKEA